MIKYYRELDKPNEFHIILRDFIDDNNIGIYKVPLDFFVKYKSLFEELKYLEFLIKIIPDDVVRKLEKKGIFIKSSKDYESRNLCTLTEIKENGLGLFYNGLNAEKDDIIGQLLLYNDVIDDLKILPFIDSEKYNKIKKEIKEAYQYLENLKFIVSKIGSTCISDYSNGWYITSIGDLYNPGNGHKETNLKLPLDNVEYCIKNNVDLRLVHKKLIEERTNIIKKQSITQSQYNNYLNNECSFAFFDKDGLIKFTHCEINSGYESHDPKLIKMVLGVISAEIDFYRFFSNLQLYTKNPIAEFYKILKMCNNEISEILVRCCNVAKVETNLDKTISTCDLTDFEKYGEYLKRGWNLRIDSPIIIDREERIVKDLDIFSPITEKYVDNKIKNYENKKQDENGKIYKKSLILKSIYDRIY